MIYRCKIKDTDGIMHVVPLKMRGVQHNKCVIIGNLAMEAYEQGIMYAKLISYETEMDNEC